VATRGRATKTAAKKKAAPKKPVWKEVEEREGRRLRNRVRQRRFRRLAIVYDIEGPHVRLGMLWFLVELVAMLGGVWGLTLLYAPTAAVAAMQTAVCLRKVGRKPNRIVAGAGAGAMVVAGAITTGMVGIAILGLVAAAMFVALQDSAAGRRRVPPIVDAAATVRCALFPGFAAACLIITARFSLGAAIALIFLVAAYETGDYIVGSGAANPFEGPVAGATAIVVVTFAITALGVKPLAFPTSFALGALACVLCPIGQLVASAVLPSVTAPASALRRLDSLLVLAPAALATSHAGTIDHVINGQGPTADGAHSGEPQTVTTYSNGVAQ